jgi:hypothetical protein
LFAELARGVRLREGCADAVFAGGGVRVDFRGTREVRRVVVTGSGVVVVAAVAVVSVTVGDGDGCGCAALDSSVVTLTSSGNRAPVAETRFVPLPRVDETSGARVAVVVPEASASPARLQSFLQTNAVQAVVIACAACFDAQNDLLALL